MWSSTMGVVAAATLAVAAGRPTLTNITRADEILVTIPHLGQVAGRPADHASGVAFFGGIPYGKAPVDDLRWQPPVAHGPWDGKLDASKFGSICWQRQPNPYTPTDMTEDCLDINVFAPTATLEKPEADLPVMVWFHGGAYKNGDGDIPGETLVARAGNRMIVVSANYRLGLFGFAANAELQKQTSDGSAGNFGIQDQRMVLEWVREHIGAFGGDGRAITIFGNSAGGNSVWNHMTAPASKGLFRAGIIMAGAYNDGASSMEVASQHVDLLLERTSCADIACLRAMSAEALITADYTGEDDADWGPTVDGVALPATPLEMVTSGDYDTRIPLLIGSNRDEFASYLLMEDDASLLCGLFGKIAYDTIMSDLATGWGKKERDEITKLYNDGAYVFPKHLGPWCIKYWWQMARIGTDTVPGLGQCSVRWLARLFAGAGTPVRAYQFAQPTECSSALDAPFCEWVSGFPGITVDSKPFAVGHGEEIFYGFDGSWWMPEGEQREVATAFSGLFEEFGRTGAVADWPLYSIDEDNTLVVQGASLGGVRIENHLRSYVCDYMQEHPPFASDSASMFADSGLRFRRALTQAMHSINATAMA